MAQTGGAGAFKDVILALGIVGAVLGGLFIYTGVWPPMVVVESGSMMHADAATQTSTGAKAEVPYGRVGYIDPGDMVFVKKVGKREDVQTLAEGTAQGAGPNYGKPGDVLVYFPYGQTQRTPIIHRALTWVEVQNVDGTACRQTNTLPDNAVITFTWDGQAQEFRGSQGVTYAPLSLGASGSGWKPCWSGFLTKGDNPITNRAPDQAFGAGGVLPKDPVRLDWVEGKAVGELPWFGLIKLALSGEQNYPCVINGVPVFQQGDPACDNGGAVKILNANAPADLWVMLGVSLAIIAIAPLAYDMYILKRKQQGGEPVAAGSSPANPLAALLEKLGLGPKKGPPEEGVDPGKAFEPPPAPPPAAPPSSPPGGSAPPPSGGAKFERVKK